LGFAPEISTSFAYFCVWVFTSSANSATVVTAISSTGSPIPLGLSAVDQFAALKVQHVPYKVGGPATTALIGGQAQIGFAHPASAMAFCATHSVITTASRTLQEVLGGRWLVDREPVRCGTSRSTANGIFNLCLHLVNIGVLATPVLKCTRDSTSGWEAANRRI
jgi:hypothetical protein